MQKLKKKKKTGKEKLLLQFCFSSFLFTDKIIYNTQIKISIETEQQIILNMDRSSNSGPKVSQIANIFQRKPIDDETEIDTTTSVITNNNNNNAVTRTESHSTRFNNARALFEKLGVENRTPRPSALSLNMTNSSSREDNVGSDSQDSRESLSPKRTTIFPIGNGGTKRDPAKISRVKPDKPEKPEKPERKFNSKELIEKQKNWTSHFTKTRTSRFNSDPNRCDIIRSMPGTVHYPGQETPPLQQQQHQQHQQIQSQAQPASVKEISRSRLISKSVDSGYNVDSPPEPPIRQQSTNSCVPEVKPRISSRSSSMTSPYTPTSPVKTSSNASPNKILPNNLNRNSNCTVTDVTAKQQNHLHINSDIVPEKRKKSIDLIDEGPSIEYAQVKKHSIDLSTISPGQTKSSTPSVSSGPSSPVHTEDEKQENESNEKSDLYEEIITECK